jgi:Tfp pilus assembly protein PilN
MPAINTSVNLLDTESTEESPISRIVSWAITFGRYIMITTEIIVLLAFISRFSLDRKLTDLNETITQKQAIIAANKDFENDFNNVKAKINRIKTLISDQNKPYQNLISLKSSLPVDVYIEKLSITPNMINGSAIANTTNGFAIFIYKLQASGNFDDISLGEIKKDPSRGLVFSFTATKQKTEIKKPITPAPEKPETTTKKSKEDINGI